MRTSADIYTRNRETGEFRLLHGFDYDNEAWVMDGVYQDCNHPADWIAVAMAVNIRGKNHA